MTQYNTTELNICLSRSLSKLGFLFYFIVDVLLHFLLQTFTASQIYCILNILTALCCFTLSPWGNKTSNTRSEWSESGMWHIDFHFFLGDKTEKSLPLFFFFLINTSYPRTTLGISLAQVRLWLARCQSLVNRPGRAQPCVHDLRWLWLTGYSVQLCPFWPAWTWHLPLSAAHQVPKRELRLKSF